MSRKGTHPRLVNKGIIFIEFVDANFAEKFMSAISTDKTSTPLVNAKKELPIIEYSFIDQRIQHKK